MKQNAWLWYLAFVVAIGQYYFVSSVSSTPDADLYTAIGVSALVAVVAGMIIHRDSSRVGWALIAVSIALYLTGDAVLAGLQDDNAIVPFPSNADWIYLAMYPVLIAAVVIIRRSIVAEWTIADVLDGIAVGAAAFAVIGAIYMNELFGFDLFGVKAQIVGSAYPLLDVALIAVAAWFALGVSRVAPGLAMISIGPVLVGVGNAVFNVQNADFTFEAGGVADLCWLGFTSLLGAAALHPSARRRTDAPTVEHGSRTALHVAALGAIPVGHLVWGSRDDIRYTVAAAAVAIGIVGWRSLSRRSPAAAPSTAAVPANGV
ncbi:hypothetical protein [Ilumatobacter coccineus]|uniref:Uncharacterized protein n=1 Tax=Ilumatobacter coccineus (strain NBRC 103263 / KCTC 29153 / YM16-304) TaxID=1313172 RepID=A0A6C7E812_ILUCY|nr:hypothetical protein [Ilumatobacter coccineus]BAN02611.1 hypothetical protein YM304_22970 [Ilumatobacter coccineus YM16-304]